MKTVIRLIVSAAMVCLVATVASAADGVLISSKVTSSGGGAPQTTEVQIEKTRLRMENIDPTGNRTVVMFDATKGVFDIIDVTKKTYMELTKAQMEQMGQQLNAMMAQMDAAMANMPPAQRAQMEAMMRGRGAGGGMAGMVAAAVPTYKKVGTDTVGKWTCDKYEGTTNGQKTSEICTVAPAALGLGPADFEVMQKLADMVKTMLPPQMSGMIQTGAFGVNGVEGIPVKSTTTAMGRETVSEVTDVSRKTFADTIFQIPAGFTKTEMPNMMGGRGRQ